MKKTLSNPAKQLMFFEADAYMAITMQVLSISVLETVDKEKMNGLTSFLTTGLNLDLSIFIWEALKLEPDLLMPEDKVKYYENLKCIRDNVHTYFKHGGFDKKAHKIVQNDLIEYKMLEPDFLDPLRSDIALLYEVRESGNVLLGSDYFLKHCIFESEVKNEKWTGEIFQDYSSLLTRSLNNLIEHNRYKSIKFNCPMNETTPKILFKDFRSEKLFDDTLGLSEAEQMRLILMLFQLSYGILLINYIINISETDNNALFCFLIKVLAIKYDESVDNFESMFRYSKNKEVLKNCFILSSDSELRSFAQNLRNTIHYQEIKPGKKSYSQLGIVQIVNIYLANTKTKDFDEFKLMGFRLIEESRKLQDQIQQYFNHE